MQTVSYIAQQVWPNLAADVIWVPLVWAWHHTHFRRTLQRELERHHIQTREEK